MMFIPIENYCNEHETEVAYSYIIPENSDVFGSRWLLWTMSGVGIMFNSSHLEDANQSLGMALLPSSSWLSCGAALYTKIL